MQLTLKAANCDAQVHAHDARAVANALLDIGDALGMSITNLSLQKLLYFAHGSLLVEERRPLVSGTFEAWKNGPVHPLVYATFKIAGSRPIQFRAEGKEMLTGEPKPLDSICDERALTILDRIVRALGSADPWRLVQISHAKNSPWDHIMDKAQTGIVLGLRIPDTVIIERFAYHKMCVDRFEVAGEWIAESPFA